MLKTTLVALTLAASSQVLAVPTLLSNNLSNGPRIVGGEESTPHTRTYQVSVQDSSGSHFCGGSIIGDDLILTAAHCMEGVNGDDPDLLVRVGAHSLSDGSGQAMKVVTTYTNQEYPGLSKDLAVLKLESKITDVNAHAIELADPAFFDANISAGSAMLVSGWGTLSSGGQMPDKLMEVLVPYVSNEVCNQANAYNGMVQATEICGGYQQGGKDSCQGDSGGPLVVAQGDKMVQVGVVSWGEGCAGADKYGVYANVAALRGWIDNAVAGNELPSGLGGGQGGETGGSGDPDSETPEPVGEQTYFAFQETVSYSYDQETLEFVIDIPQGTNLLYIATSGGQGDVDITAEILQQEYAGEGEFEDEDYSFLTDFYYSAGEDNNELIIIERPTSGEWRVSLSSFAEYQAVELTVIAH
jgi:trypsin